MKMKEFGPPGGGGRVRGVPLRSTNAKSTCFMMKFITLKPKGETACCRSKTQKSRGFKVMGTVKPVLLSYAFHQICTMIWD